jgi:hypothetical protein
MAKQACDYTKWIVVVLIVVLIIVLYMSMKKSSDAKSASTKEGFEFDQSQYAGAWMMSPPNLGFGAPIAPRSQLPNLTSNSLLGDAAASMYGAAPPNPMSVDTGVKVDFTTMGGADSLPYGAISSQQAQDMLKDRVTGGTPEMVENALPLGDINQLSMDPTLPSNFLADRTIFSKLKRQYGNAVDFIRGDIDVTQEYRGWFDVRPATEKDIVTGYFDRYLDIQQYTALRDAQFTRSTPVEQLYSNAVQPAGNVDLLAYTKI